MTTTQGGDAKAPSPVRLIGRIPVRNIWLLFLYASDLARFQGRFAAEVEESPDLPSLIARLLCHVVARRLRRNLSRGYQHREAVLSRVRGRIDVLQTFSDDLIQRGTVACRFDDFTIDTPRNRLVRAALDALAGRIEDADLAHECRRLAGDLGRQGVTGLKPSRAALSADQIGRHDADDLMMVTLARMVFALVLPSEEDGVHSLPQIDREERIVRALFEKAVGNFLRIELQDWTVRPGRKLKWQITTASAGAESILPGMVTDIFLEQSTTGRRIIIDTKFTEIFTKSIYRLAVLRSGYIYQMYAYLRSQVSDEDPASAHAEGVLLHPAVGIDVDEHVVVQGHSMRFMTVDLGGSAESIRRKLRTIVDAQLPVAGSIDPE